MAVVYITYCVEYCVNCSLNTHYITMLTATHTIDIVEMTGGMS